MPEGESGLTIAVAGGGAVIGAATAAPIAATAPIPSAVLAAIIAETTGIAVNAFGAYRQRRNAAGYVTRDQLSLLLRFMAKPFL